MKEKILNYIGQDGLLHILCCIVLVSVIDIVLPLWGCNYCNSRYRLGEGVVWDKWLGRGTFDKKDLLCDLVGIIIGCL